MKYKHKKTGRIAIPFSERTSYYLEGGNVCNSYPKWMIEDSNDWEEIKEVPEYVKCIKHNLMAPVGEVCKVLLAGTQNFHYIKTKSGDTCSMGSTTYNECFIPATKEEFNKQDQLLFTTEDGVDIFKGDKYYYVTLLFNIEENHAFAGYYPANKFSTKKKAEEYVLMNKPCLSINDVNVLKNIVFANWDKTLKDLVKSKI